MKPKLRSDIEFVRTGPQRFLVLDPFTGRRFEARSSDRFLLDLLDGERDLDEIRDCFEARFSQPLSQRHLREFLNQLEAEGVLASPEDQSAAPSPVPEVPSSPARRWTSAREG